MHFLKKIYIYIHIIHIIHHRFWNNRKLSLLSHQIGVNKSKTIEKLIKEYSLEKEAIYVLNSSGQIAIPINKIAIKVAKILKQK